MKQQTQTTIPCPHCGKPVDISRDAVQTGKQGGQTTKKRYGKEYLRELGRQGALKRWKKQPAEEET